MIQFLKRHRYLTDISQLGIVYFIIAIGLAFIDTIWAVYLYSYLHSDVIVGVISTIFTVVSLTSYLALIPFLERFDKLNLFKIALFSASICYLLFAISPNIWIIILLGCILSVISVVRINSAGIIIKECSTETNLAENEGFMYTVMNLGWLLGPIIAGFVSGKYDIPLVFVLSSIFMITALAMLIISKINFKEEKDGKVHKNFVKNVKEYLKEKDLVKTYIISGSSAVWWCFNFIYVPIHIIEAGLGIEWVAYFLFAMIVPQVLLEYYFGKKTNKIGFRILFTVGNSIMALVLLVCLFVQNIYMILGLLVLGSVGISMLEATTEAYFFLVAPKRKTAVYYSIYNTTGDIFSIVGKLFIAGILALLAFKYSFLLLALVFTMFAAVSLTMKPFPGLKQKNT
ncbi:MAG: MFS transporter [archaeon]